MSSSSYIRILTGIIIVIVVGTPLFYLKESIYPYTFSKTLFFEAAVELLFFLYLVLALSDARYRPRWTPLTIAITAFLAVLVLISLAGVDPWRSFWSTQERMVGVIAFVHLAALAVIASSLGQELRRTTILYASLATALLISGISFLQLQNPNLLLNEPVGNRPGSTFGNPTFLAGYLLFNIFIALYYLLHREGDERHEPPRQKPVFEVVFLGVSLVLCSAALVLTQTRGDIVGLGAGFFALMLLFAFRPPRALPHLFRSRVLYGAISLVGIFLALGFWFTRANAIWQKVPILDRFADISLSRLDLQPRLIALKDAWQGFLDRPLTGSGWENFNIVYNKYYDPKALQLNYQETRFDKPHNVFLEYLVVGGAPLLLTYLGLIGAFLYEIWKTRDRLWSQIGTALTIGYLVRSVFIFDTIGPLLMFFLLVGIVDGRYLRHVAEERAQEPGGKMRERNLISRSAIVVFLVIACVPVYILPVKSMAAGYHQFWGFTDFVKKKPEEAIAHFKEAIGTWSPYTWNLVRDYAAVIAENYFYDKKSVPPEEAWMAIHAMEKVSSEHPMDAFNHYMLVDLYNEVSDLDPATLLPAAEREGKIALELSPNRQQVLFSLAKTKHLEGDDAGAIALVKRGLALNPEVPDAHFYYGLLAFSSGDPATGYSEIRKALALGREWRNYNEPRVVGGFFADAGHLDEAIELYQKALAMEPDDVESKIKLGVAYFFKNEYALSRDYFRDAMRGYDLTKSNSYADLKPILDRLGIVP